MKNNKWQFLWTVCALGVLASPVCALAENGDEDDLSMTYGDQEQVSIATGSKVPVSRAPSVATVITAEDISNSGYTNIDDVLEMVPGLHVSRNSQSYQAIYVMRGIGTQYNPEVLMLQNGQPMTSIYEGNRGDGWTGMSVEHIARIEVIRGPGSALYGADAFAGVINIVTKDSSQTAGTHVGVNAGKFDDREAWLENGSKWGDLSFSGDVHVLHTRGSDARITSDAQTVNDKAFGTDASLAPGSVNRGYDGMDLHLDLGWHEWKLRASQLQRENIGAGAGVASALDPTGTTNTQTTLINLGYGTQQGNWALSGDTDYYHRHASSDLTLFPAGASFNGATFPNGVIGDPAKQEDRAAVSGAAVYTGLQDHRLRFGVGRERSAIYQIEESKNFTFVYTASCQCYLPGPLGSLVDVSGTDRAYMQPHQRWVTYGYLQDEWNMTRDLTLTAGLRQDRYSDFGQTTNPRLALVWNAAYNVTTKLLYGSAFRAPSFVELYAINNPVAQGNPSAKPEKIDTTEFAIDWQPRSALQLGFNVFHYRMRDILNYVASSNPTSGTMVENTGAQYGNGFEVEEKWAVSNTIHLNGNYAFQRSVDEATNDDAGIAPHHHVFLQGSWDFVESWRFSSDFNWVADRERQPGDPRRFTVPDYHTFDVSLGKHQMNDLWSVQFTIRNLFNADVREPSFAGSGIPNDLPMDRRTYSMQAMVHF